MSQRLQGEGAIQRDRPLSFTFDGKPHTGYEATQLGSRCLLDLGRMVLSCEQQPSRVGEIPCGDVGALGVARDMQASVSGRELYDRRPATAPIGR